MLLLLHAGAASAKTDREQRRIAAWQALIASHQVNPELDRVRRVNEFLNQMRYVEDSDNWGVRDYWATPREFVAANGGDCEDFAIAKYFTLQAMGVPEARLQMVYAMSLPQAEPHMVLYYYPEEQSTPVVLDNRANQLKRVTSRTDLHPVYSFNRRGYWLNGPDGRQRYLGAPSSLSRWKGVLQRRDKERRRNM